MARIEKQRGRLIALLGDLFQLNQPDLDFGFYRIMHAKADRVSNFLQNDLLKIIKDAFGEADGKRVEEARLAYEAAVKQAKEFGASNPEETEPVKKAKAAYDAIRDAGNGEGEIYDHLFRFFERYYDNGDFMSRRYYARETDGKAAPYSVPYDGREVYLHWANRDQYYIKTSEYLTNFTFNLANAPELKGLLEQEERKVHCRIVDAVEGEHGNVKTTDKTERYFLIHKEAPVKIENGDLVIQFEYRPDPEKSGQGGKWQERRIEDAEKMVLEALRSLADAEVFLSPLSTLIGQEKNRTLLRRYLNQYTSRNTMDYFIHKDLGGFMRRELDFYIKNEIMRLDDIESADVPRVDFYLSKIKVLRKIAHHLIDFIAQLEDFQKKLWLKKKFVVETNYCITLDRIPEPLYADIAANDAQRDAWVKLYAIDELKGYKNLLSVAFLKDNPFLVLDTAFFEEAFKARLLAEIQDLDETVDGLLIHSENFQALEFLKTKNEGLINSIYIDPPYNTDAAPILYKNNYKNSSWTTMMNDRISSSIPLLVEDGVLCATIDDYQQKELSQVISNLFEEKNILGNVAIRINPSGRVTLKGFAQTHEYAIFAGKTEKSKIWKIQRSEEQNARFNENDDLGDFEWRNFRREGSASERASRPHRYFPIYVDGESFRIPAMDWDEVSRSYINIEPSTKVEEIVYPVDSNGGERVWRWGIDRIKREHYEIVPKINNKGVLNLYYKYRPNEEGILPPTIWVDKKYSATEYGTAALKKIFGGRNSFDFPKSIYAVEDCIDIAGIRQKNSTCLDYFGGSGTTAEAVININRKDNGKRKYILVEMGEHFGITLKPRIERIVYSREWNNGQPETLGAASQRHKKEILNLKKELKEINGISNREDYEFERQRIEGNITEAQLQIDRILEILEADESSLGGISHCFKYIRLESYEDALNNLTLREDATRTQALAKNDDFRREYMLNYWLEFETKGSSSLLSVEQFSDPTAYKLKIKKTGSDEYVEKAIDLIETFNWLIGLHVDHIDAPRTFGGKFKREADPELPNDQTTRLILDGKLADDANGKWWFRKVEGRVCRTPGDKKNMDKVLVIWRKLTGNLEEDNLMLDEWFRKYRLSTQDTEFDVIYVNGSNNLPNLKRDDENWKVRLIEESFHQKMWDVEG